MQEELEKKKKEAEDRAAAEIMRAVKEQEKAAEAAKQAKLKAEAKAKAEAEANRAKAIKNAGANFAKLKEAFEVIDKKKKKYYADLDAATKEEDIIWLSEQIPEIEMEWHGAKMDLEEV